MEIGHTYTIYVRTTTSSPYSITTSPKTMNTPFGNPGSLLVARQEEDAWWVEVGVAIDQPRYTSS